MSTESLSCGSQGSDSEGLKTEVEGRNWEPPDADRKVDYKVVEIDMEYAMVRIGEKMRVED